MADRNIVPFAELDTERLIKEIKKRPCLYARDSPKYGDMQHRRAMWEEIASILFKSVWANYDADERADKVELCLKRWKNVRACFRRELKRQKDPKWIYGVAYRRRKYIYFNDLAFLKYELDKSNTDDEGNEIDLPDADDVDVTTVSLNTNIEITPIPDPVPLPSAYKTVKQVEDPTSSSKTEDNPAATHFAQSLIPMLNMIPANKMIDAQIAILTVLKRFLQEEDGESMNKRSEIKKVKTYSKRRAIEKPIEVKSESDSDNDVINLNFVYE